MFVYEDELDHSGLDRKKVLSIARRISRAGREATAMGIEIFGGSSGELRFRDDFDLGSLQLVALDGPFDGG